MTSDLDQHLTLHLTEATEAVAAVADFDDLRALDAELLGKASVVTEARRGLGALVSEQRKDAGRRLNEVRAALEHLLAERRSTLEAGVRAATLEAERLDLTELDTGRRLGHRHVVTQTWERLEDIFVGMGFTVAEGPEIEDEWHNFGALNFPPDHPARDMYDTLYVDHGEPGAPCCAPTPPRSRSGSWSPSNRRSIRSCRGACSAATRPTPPTCRCSTRSRAWSSTGASPSGTGPGTMDPFTKAYFGREFTSRLRPSYFPFTEPSAEFDVLRDDGSWLELAGCGMVHPNVLQAGASTPRSGPASLSGLASTVWAPDAPRHRRPAGTVPQRPPLPVPVLMRSYPCRPRGGFNEGPPVVAPGVRTRERRPRGDR
ncbi:MAG: hypothetical protein CM1200mP26_27800 [Acidimicrobiales bacterium]|nr:MAG: hypothetical protein CM1200mP26_27800 [Acidimicrobiales bacterium]